MALITAGLVVTAVWALSRVPTGFLPIEDQGYFIVVVQLPEGAALERTTRALDDITTRVKAQPGVDKVVAIAGLAALNDNASLSNAGIAYVILNDWDKRGKGEDLLGLYKGLTARVADIPDGYALVIPPPAIQGIGNVAGATMKVEIRDGSFDYDKLQRLAQAIADRAGEQSMIQQARNVFLADAPQINVVIDRVKAETLGVPLGNALDALSSYVGSSYVGQFNKFGRVFQIYVQAEAAARLSPENLQYLEVRNTDGKMVPLGTLASVRVRGGAVGDQPLQPLSGGDRHHQHRAGVLHRARGSALLEQIAKDTLPPGTGYEWTAMSYQEKEVGNQIYLVYGLSLLLVYLVLAGQYESWIAPVTVIASVPLALLGTAAALLALGVANNLYTQIGLILLIALVEQERDPHRRGGARAAHPRGQGHPRRRGRGRALALPPDPDDVVRLHPRRGAAGARLRRRRQRAEVDRHRGADRHARLDAADGRVRAVDLRGAAALRGMAPAPQVARQRSPCRRAGAAEQRPG